MPDDKLWILVLRVGLGVCPVLAGCSGEPAGPGASAGGSGGAAGSGGASGGGASGSGGASGGGGASGSGGASFPTWFTFLTGDSALPSMTPAPAEYTTTCAICHGTAAQGVSPIGPEIRHPAPAYLSWIVRNGRKDTTMIAYPTITDTTIAEIQSWLVGLPKPAAGDQLYLDFCGNCHGPTGEDGASSTYLRGKQKEELTSATRKGIAPQDPSLRFSYMPPISAAELSDAELDLITTFLGAVP